MSGERPIGNAVKKTAAARGPDRDDGLVAGVPLSRVIPRKLSDAKDVVMLSQPHSVAAEKFRRLKTQLARDGESESQVILVTSAAPEEGKSFIALNIALAFAGEAARETLLIDADLRRPTIGGRLQPAPAIGLTEVLSGKTTVEHAIYSLKNNQLKILPAGEPTRESVELIASPSFKSLIASLRKRFWRVVIDTPPAVPFTDADALAENADGVLMVVRAGQTPRPQFEQATSLIKSAPILGVVLNDLKPSLADGFKNYHSYYHSRYYDRDRKK
ncbi:MAG: CpsD/CapB family tyrosine-protein kinase [Acidobacteriota bacterium]|nr:CpsD/CapB family tyrosine-protein kinase [Acidobacteriota bacterium]